MPSLQTQTAIDTLSELYGEPSWITDPKPGQNVDKVFAEWDKALKKYSDTQVANACRSIYKYKKSATFPRLGHLLAELVDIVPDAEPETEPTPGYWRELADFRAECVKNGFNGHFCFSSDIDKALYRLCDEIDAEYAPEKPWDCRSVAELVKLANINGVFWDKLKAFLSSIVEKNGYYTPTGGADVYDVPARFSPNNAKRKSA